MAKEREATAEEIAEAVEALGINVPIGTTRVVGRRIELYLYGGRVVWYPEFPVSAHILDHPHRYDRKELRVAGEALGIPNAKSMNKIPLVKAIRAWREENPDEGVTHA